MQVQVLPEAPFRFPDDVKVACPPVKRNDVVRVHVGEPISQMEHVRSAEEPALKAAAP